MKLPKLSKDDNNRRRPICAEAERVIDALENGKVAQFVPMPSYVPKANQERRQHRRRGE